jgi:hypothetical protein
VIVSVASAQVAALLERAKATGVAAIAVGETGGDSLSVKVEPLGSLLVSTSQMAARRDACLAGIVGS